MTGSAEIALCWQRCPNCHVFTSSARIYWCRPIIPRDLQLC